MNQEILLIGGISIGICITYFYWKLKKLEEDIFNVAEMIPKTEDVAKEILSMKIPLGALPPHIQETIKAEALNAKDTNYFG